MKFLVDRHIPRKIIVFLEDKGFVVRRVRPMARNSEIAEEALKSDYTIITADIDFVSGLSKKYLSSVKRIVIRFRRYVWDNIYQCFKEMFDEILDSLKKSSLVILKEKNLKVEVNTNAIIIECQS